MWLLLLQSTAHVVWRLVSRGSHEKVPSGHAWTRAQAVGEGGEEKEEDFFSPAMVVARLASRRERAGQKVDV